MVSCSYIAGLESMLRLESTTVSADAASHHDILAGRAPVGASGLSNTRDTSSVRTSGRLTNGHGAEASDERTAGML